MVCFLNMESTSSKRCIHVCVYFIPQFLIFKQPFGVLLRHAQNGLA